ncbi:MAG: hypothetical protein V1913_15465, partial [Fibrobacterota bacterium]
MMVHYGDPLYAPFQSSVKYDDNIAPEFGLVMTKRVSTTSRKIIVNLADGDDDKKVDVAQYKIEYGVTVAYDSVMDFETGWSSGIDGVWKNENLRNYFLARQSESQLTGLLANQVYHYRITAKDPWGNIAATPDLTFNTALNADTGIGSGNTGTETRSMANDFRISLFPQPANPDLTLQFMGAEAVPVPMEIKIFNLAGKEIRHLYNGKSLLKIKWDGRDNRGDCVASGIYVVRCRINNRMMFNKALLIR